MARAWLDDLVEAWGLMLAGKLAHNAPYDVERALRGGAGPHGAETHVGGLTSHPDAAIRVVGAVLRRNARGPASRYVERLASDSCNGCLEYLLAVVSAMRALGRLP